ncbi:MAG: hypothetical protein Phog2KO_02010 [Phototrophicaceae bacterium]
MANVSTFIGTNFMNRQAPYGFGIRFFVNDDKSVYANVTFDDSKEGGKDILHGGAIATVLDEAMGAAAYEAESAGYTATMTYNYHAHIPLYQDIAIKAWVERVEGKKIFTACEAKLPNETIAVRGTALFIASPDLHKYIKENPYLPENE